MPEAVRLRLLMAQWARAEWLLGRRPCRNRLPPFAGIGQASTPTSPMGPLVAAGLEVMQYSVAVRTIGRGSERRECSRRKRKDAGKRREGTKRVERGVEVGK
jgi:hypothetical protein